MDLKTTFEKIKPWIKPCLICLLGLTLLFRPSSITNALAGIVGCLIAAVGAGLMVQFITRKPGEFLKLIAGIVLLIMGVSVIHDPATLVTRLTRFIGVFVLLYALRGYLHKDSTHSGSISTAACILGAVLLVMPNTAARLVFTVCGIGLLAVGVTMILDQKNAAPKSDVIDAE